MAQKTIAQLKAVNASTFGAGKDTLGDDEKAFNDDQLDSLKPLDVVISANKTAILGESYVLVASATFTDPSPPVEGKGYTVFIRNGTATINSVAYDMAGATITRIYHSGGWKTYVSNAAGEWTPTVTTGFDSASAIKATYQVVGPYVVFQIRAEVINSTLIEDAPTSFTVPDQFPMSTASDIDCMAAISFRQNVSASILENYVNAATGTIQVLISSATLTPAESYEFTLSGAYKIA